MSRKLKLYLPFLAVMLVQAAFVAVAPSDAPGGAGSFSAGGFDEPSFDGAGPDDGAVSVGDEVAGADPGSIDADGGDGTFTETVDPTTGAVVRTPVTRGDPASPGAATDDPDGAEPRAAAGDTSHCKGDRQFDILLNNPACKPRHVGPNGGATYPGVAADTIKIVQWEYVPNAAVDAVLAPQGLGNTRAQREAIDRASKKFIEENYELYGRKLEIIRVSTDCPTSPQDVPKCKAEARRVIEMQPFIVMIGTVNYPEIYDEFARAGIITVGGWHWPQSYFTQRRPFRWDLFADGNQSADIVAEYYCKKLQGKPASHAGRVIHPQIPNGRSTPRKVGILTPERDTDVATAEIMAAKLAPCAGGKPLIVKYSPDINTTSEQAEGYTQRLIAEGITTVICFCDPVAPAILTKTFTRLTYFPEHLMTGTGLLDYDLLGRLYDTQQWVHAFGPGHLFDPLPFDQQEVSRMWRAAGQDGEPCSACNLNWSYYALVGGMLHEGGPNLTPATVEQNLLNAKPYGGDRPGSVLVKYGPGDYTAVSDAREVYWDPNAVSKIDGRPGAYVTMNNSARYEIGEWTGDFTVPVPSS